MGEVYRADDLKLDEPVALKFLPEEVENDPRKLALLLDEARLARKISHPNICRVHDVAETEEGLHFLSMEYIDGEDLASLLRRIGRLPRAKALDIARELVQALEAAHRAGILHRDLKPANIMLDGAGRVRVTDFGLAGAIGSALGGGTPAYMAPELHHRQRPTVQSDLYALALVLYELFTGQKAFKARSLGEMARLHAETEPPRPSTLVPDFEPKLEELLFRCLRKDPARRPSSLRELDQILAGLQTRSDFPSAELSPEPPQSALSVSSVWKPISPRHRGLWLAVAALALISYLLATRPWRSVDPPINEPLSVTAPSNAPARVQVRPGMAILEMRNLSGAPEADWIGLATAEMLLTELSAGLQYRLVSLADVHTAIADLELVGAETPSKADLQRLGRRLQVDHIVSGSFSKVGQETEGFVRLDLQLFDTDSGDLVVAKGATGVEAQLFDLALRVGQSLRAELSEAELSATQTLAVRASLPRNSKAARLYVEGLEHLRSLELSQARDSLLQAVELEPEHPMPHAALSEVWWKLGYEGRARAAAAEAVAWSDSLGREDRLVIQARTAKLEHRFDEAITGYEELIRDQPDQLDFRFALAETQLQAGALQEARVVLEQTRTLPSPLGEHPRIDHLDARIHRFLGDHKQHLELARRAADKSLAMEAKDLAAAARLQEAIAWQKLGDFGAEAVAAEHARVLYEDLGNRAGIARCLQQMGNSRLLRGDLEGAERLLQRALALYREIGHELNVATASLTLGVTDYRRGRLDSAARLLEQAADVFRRLDNDSYLGNALINLGAVLQVRGDLDEALTSYHEAFGCFSGLGDRAMMAVLLNNIGEILYYRGDLADARRSHSESQAINREIGNLSGLGYSTYRLAKTYVAGGDLLVARSHFEEAFEILERIDDALTLAEARLGLAEVADLEDALDEASTLAGQAEEVFRTSGAVELRGLARTAQGEILLRRHRVAEARKVTEEVRSQVAPGGDRLLDYRSRLLEARLLSAEGETADSLGVLESLGTNSKAAGYLGFELEAEVLAAEIANAAGDPSAARRLEGLLVRVEEHGYGALAQRVRGLGDSRSRPD